MSAKHHSPFGPSSLARRAACPGSFHAEKDQPEQTNEAAQEGTNLHAIMEKVLIKDPSEWPSIELNDEQMAMCQFCYHFAENFRKGFEWHIEEWIDLSFVHTQIEGGTADFIAVEPFKQAVVIDWKFGRGSVSRAADNIQAAAYAVGVAKKYDVPKVVTYICHAPYSYISCFEYEDAQITATETALKMIVQGCLMENAPRVADPDACKYCKGAKDCPQVHRMAQTLAVVENVENLPATTIAKLLDQCEIVADAVGAIEQRAYAVLESGGQIPGWTLKAGAQRRAWADDAAARLEKVATDLKLRADLLWEPKVLVTPAVLEKAWGKKKEIAAAMEALIVKKQNRSSLVREKK